MVAKGSAAAPASYMLLGDTKREALRDSKRGDGDKDRRSSPNCSCFILEKHSKPAVPLLVTSAFKHLERKQ
jgi:hypothetical protein